MKLQSVACIAMAGLATALAGCGQPSDTSKSAANTPPAALSSDMAAANSPSKAPPSASSDMASAPDSAAKPAAGAPDASESQMLGSPAATGTDDATISSEVEAAIKSESTLESQPITVATANATVTLSGSVASKSLSSRAQRIAMATPGVKNVVNELSVQAS